MKQSVTVDAQLLWSGRYGCNNGRYGCTIVMSYIEINKAVSQWLLTFNLCVSVTWPLTCAFHIPCTHTPEIIDMHRGMCDKTHTHCTRHGTARANGQWLEPASSISKCCWVSSWSRVNSLWPSDAITWQGTESTLAQVMAWCRQAPSHYLNQCWLIS